MIGILWLLLCFTVIALVAYAFRTTQPRKLPRHRPSADASQCICGEGWPCLDTAPIQRTENHQ